MLSTGVSILTANATYGTIQTQQLLTLNVCLLLGGLQDSVAV